MTRLLRRSRARHGVACSLGVALAMIATGVSGPRGGNGAVWAQAPNPCTLLKTGEIQALAPTATIAEGVSASPETPGGYDTCRYTWGTGANRFKLDVIVRDASRTFPGMTPVLIKQRLLASVKPETTEKVIADVGDAAVFKSDSPYYATAIALLKGQILELHLDGSVAREMRDQTIALLKSAASRL